MVTISMAVGSFTKRNTVMYEWTYFEDESRFTFHPIADADNLYDAFQKARKGSHWKGQVQRFRWDTLLYIRRLQKELDALEKGKDGAYELSPYSRFLVNERGKTRAITALSIRDRVVKHALNDLYLLPHFKPHLIYDNGASLPGKGVSFTRKRLIAHLEQFYKQTGSNDGYIMTMDFGGYYDNIDHATAMQMIRKYEPDSFARRLAWQAYDSYKVDVSYMTAEEYEQAQHTKFSTVEYRKERRTDEELTGEKFLHKSLSVGDQTSQITAIAFPTPIDNLVKIVNGFKFYARYMDDFYIIAKTKAELLEIRDKIYEMARRLKLFINVRKTHITPLRKTFRFLQFKYFLTDSGHVVVRINPKTVTRMRQKLKKLRRLSVSLAKVSAMFQSWIKGFCPYMSKRQCDGVIDLYKNLFGHGLDNWLIEKQVA